MQASNTPGIVKFSTDDLPARDRVAIWREAFGRAVVKVDFEPRGDEPFRSVSRVQALPDVTIRSSQASAAMVRRTAPLVADGDENFVMSIIRSGQMHAGQGKREVFLDQGGAYLWSNATTGFSHNPTAMDLITLTLPRRSLRHAVADLDLATMALVPAASPALRLLIGYVEILQREPVPIAPDLLALNASHIHDLAALALGATRDAAHLARSGGVRAARLLAIKADIMANLSWPGFSVAAVAARHGISSRYIRALFASEHTSFSDFLREQRLRRAYRLLTEAAAAHHTIATIAFECGFGDVSHFNHVFRARFGATPGDIRHAGHLAILHGRH